MAQLVSEKAHRHQVIRELLARNEIRNQDEFIALLHVESIDTSQATLSRDLRELGVVKGPDGYTFSNSDQAPQEVDPMLRFALREEVQWMERSVNLIVIKVTTGSGARIARQIEAAQFHQMLAAVADDETVLIVGRSGPLASDLHRVLRRIAKIR